MECYIQMFSHYIFEVIIFSSIEVSNATRFSGGKSSPKVRPVITSHTLKININ